MDNGIVTRREIHPREKVYLRDRFFVPRDRNPVPAGARDCKFSCDRSCSFEILVSVGKYEFYCFVFVLNTDIYTIIIIRYLQVGCRDLWTTRRS